MTGLAARTFADRWQLFIGTVLAVTIGVAIIHAGMTIILGVEGAAVPETVPAEQVEDFRQAAEGASTLTGMTVMLGAFLTVFVVGSTVTFAVDQRRGDLALLRLGGVTGRQVRRLLLVEALLTAVPGAVLGAVVGLGLTVVQSRILSGLGTFPEGLETPVRPAVLVLDLLAAVTVCLVGAWGAARRATRISPLDALRRSPVDQRVMTPRRWVVAGLAVVVTGVQVAFSVVVGGVLIPLLLGLGIVVSASVAMSQLAPLLVPAVARVLLLLPGVKASVVAGLAVANLRDAVRRTASCAAPMIVLVSLVMGLQGILDTQTEAAETEASRLLDADLLGTVPGGEGSRDVVNEVRDIDGVSLVAPETVVPLSIQLTEGGVTSNGPGTVVAVDPDAFQETHSQHPDTGDIADFGPDSVVLGPGLEGIAVRGHPDQITVDIASEPIVLNEAARMLETLAGEDGFYIDRALLSLTEPELLDGETSLLIQLEQGADAGAVTAALENAGVSGVQAPTDMASDEGSTADSENRAVMLAIVGLGSIYALISVLSTLAISISQRRPELAALRLSGFTRAQVQGVTVVEALAATTIGLFLGAVAAVLSLVGLWGATARIYGTPVIAIPWTLLAGITVLAFVLTTVTAVVATRRAMASPPVQVVGSE
ncbi:FtsX-like permease family protein [Corynebacterium glyciniphilum]|uniref:FtsX-like permease family protein n=1 Tax=Corynebacterium glyciniphilum TaxID=1404244 RepID=UPI0026524BCE|nr:FtsX-like permease family protein [Corynebacterium glyciniphilum]MDN6705847.1 FtsX-like permease family protein [Corynebacterium glyciniphilum]